VPQPGTTLETEAMRATLRVQLPEYMVPNLFLVLEAMPLTPNGKVDRKALPAPNPQATTSSDTESDALMTPVQRQVARLWQEVLGLARVGLHANFFDIGGHSLLLVRLQAAIQREFGHEFPLVELFQRTTVAAQADRLAAPAGGSGALERAKARAARQIKVPR
jgi:acyl carrier protein